MEYSNDLRTVDYIIRAEGGYADSPHDSGGQTLFGISRKFNPRAWEKFDELLRANDLAAAREYAKDIWLGNGPDGNGYLREWQLDRFPQKIANKLTDLLCPRNILAEAVMVLQRALWAAGGRKLAVDGIAGPVTMQRVADQCLYMSAELMLIVALRCEIANEYRSLVMRSPGQQPNLNGWLNRAYS